jgi:septal ring factor EnvC (AmiA/AmiB activator)
MSDQPENLMLVYLRRIDQKLDRLTEEVQDLKHRMTAVERQLGELFVGHAALQARMDRIEQRLDRIERRLDLVEAPARP